MDKKTFCQILESALLSFDGLILQEILSLGILEPQVKAGIKLCSYLQSIKFQEQPHRLISEENNIPQETGGMSDDYDKVKPEGEFGVDNGN